MSPPLIPDADEARRQLADELANPVYADVQNWISMLRSVSCAAVGPPWLITSSGGRSSAGPAKSALAGG